MLTRKFQLASKIEISEGTAIAVAAADVDEVFDLTLDDQTDITDRRPSSRTMSTQIEPAGRSTRRLTFNRDLVGGATATTSPAWSKYLQACGMKEGTVKAFTCSSGSGTWRPGEIVRSSAGPWAANAPYGIALYGATGASPTLYVAWMFGTEPTSGAIYGEVDSATCTVDTVASAGVFWRPTSDKLVRVSTATWGGNAPLAGEVLQVKASGLVVGSAQVVTVVSATSFDLAHQWGSMVNTNTLVRPTAYSAAINADPTQTSMVSLTMQPNIDGFLRPLVSARGNFTLGGAAHETPRFSFDFQGQFAAHSDTALLDFVVIPALTKPRLRGVSGGIIYGAQTLALPFIRLDISPNNEIVVMPDAFSSTGDRSSEIANRDPSMTFECKRGGVNSFDPETLLGTSVPIRFGVSIPGAVRTGLVCPRVQIVGIDDGDSAGNLTHILSMKPRGFGGDDEFILFQTT